MRKKLSAMVTIALLVAAGSSRGRWEPLARADDRDREKAVDAALSQLANPDRGARVAAAGTLRRLRGHTFTEVQVRALLDGWMLEPEPGIREALSEALAPVTKVPDPSRADTERGGLIALPRAARALVPELARRVKDPRAFAARIPQYVLYPEVEQERAPGTAFNSRETQEKLREEWKKRMIESGNRVVGLSAQTKRSGGLLIRYRAVRALAALGAEARDAVPALLAALGDEGRLEVRYYARSVGLPSDPDNIKTLWLDDVAAEALATVAPDGPYMSQTAFRTYKARRAARLAEAEEEERADEEAYQATRFKVLKAALEKAQSDEDRARAIERYVDWPSFQGALYSPGRPLGKSERLAARLVFDVGCSGGDAGKKATEFLRTWARLGRFTELDIEGEFREEFNPASPPEINKRFQEREPRLMKDLKETLQRAVKDAAK